MEGEMFLLEFFKERFIAPCYRLSMETPGGQAPRPRDWGRDVFVIPHFHNYIKF